MNDDGDDDDDDNDDNDGDDGDDGDDDDDGIDYVYDYFIPPAPKRKCEDSYAAKCEEPYWPFIKNPIGSASTGPSSRTLLALLRLFRNALHPNKFGISKKLLDHCTHGRNSVSDQLRCQRVAILCFFVVQAERNFRKNLR